VSDVHAVVSDPDEHGWHVVAIVTDAGDELGCYHVMSLDRAHPLIVAVCADPPDDGWEPHDTGGWIRPADIPTSERHQP
jgi:hypothetical protein